MNLDAHQRERRPSAEALEALVADHAARFRSREQGWRDRRSSVRDVMPPRLFWSPPAAVDMTLVAEAGRAVIEARKALEEANVALGRIALDAYYRGCPARKLAASAGISTTSICRYSWAAYDEQQCVAPPE